MINEITVEELKQMMDQQEPFVLIDVREPHEFDVCNLNGKLIPMNEVPDHIAEIPRTGKVVVHCRSGARSGRICDLLTENFGYTNLVNLRGGILAWADRIDPSMPKY